MKCTINLILLGSFLALSACSTNKAALKDRTNQEYKKAKEAPEIIVPNQYEKKTKRY